MSTMKRERPNAKKKNYTQQPAPESISGSVDVTAMQPMISRNTGTYRAELL